MQYRVQRQQEFDVRRFGAKGIVGVNDTAAFNAALTAAFDNGHHSVYGHGDFTVGNLTWPAGKNTLRLSGTLRLLETFSMGQGCSLIGESGSHNTVFTPFGVGPTLYVIPPVGNVATLRIHSSVDHLIENVSILEPAGIGIHLDGRSGIAANVRLRNVHVSCSTGIATSVPLKCESVFWVWIENCFFGSSTGNTAQASMWFHHNAADALGSYNGLINIRDTILSGWGTKISTTAGQVTADGNFTMKDVVLESGLGGFLLCDLPYQFNELTLDDCHSADFVADAYMLTVNNGLLKNLTIKNADASAKLINPASTGRIEGVCIENPRLNALATPHESRIFPAWTPEYELQTELGVRDFRSINNYWTGGPTQIPATSISVEQNPANWIPTGAGSITSGRLAPDGTYNAGTCVGGGAFLATPTLHSIAVGDWFIVGGWVRSLDDTKVSQQLAFQFPQTGSWALNNAGSLHNIFMEDASQNDDAWHFMSRAFKVTTLGAEAQPQLTLLANYEASRAETTFAYPFILHINAGVWSDKEVMTYVRSMRHAPTGAQQGDVAILNHQRLRLGGGVRLVSASAFPQTGTWLVGDIIKNTVPSVGQPKGWICTVTGTQGTLTGVTGSITSGQRILTVNTAAALQLGHYITIVGVTGIKKIVRISGTTITLDSTASATVSTAAVAFSAATFVSEGNL